MERRRSALAHFEFGILFVDHIEAPLPPDDLAVSCALLDRCSYFHIVGVLFLFIPEGDPSLRQVIGRHLDLDPVAGENLDIVHSHFAGDMGRDDMPVLKLDLEHCVAQGFENYTVLFYRILFCHCFFILMVSVVSFSSSRPELLLIGIIYRQA